MWNYSHFLCLWCQKQLLMNYANTNILSQFFSTYHTLSHFCCFIQKSKYFWSAFRMTRNDIFYQNLWLERPFSQQYRNIEITWPDFIYTPSKVSSHHHNRMGQILQEYEILLNCEFHLLRYQFRKDFCFQYPIQMLF